MRIDVRINSKRSSGTLRSFAEGLLARKLGAHASAIQHAQVRLSDINGPRGGIDKECRIRLAMGRSGAVQATHSAFDWYDAVIGAVAVVRTAVAARFDRLDERRRSGRRTDRYQSSLAAADAETAQLAAPPESTR